jgi:hypothetical protein
MLIFFWFSDYSPMHITFWSENPKGKGHSEDLSVDGKILEWILGKIAWGSVDWMHLAQDRDSGGLL